MAGTKISGLTLMPNTLVDTDIFPIVDISVNTTYKLTKLLLRKYFLDNPADGDILRYSVTAADWIAATPATLRYRTVLTTRYTGLIGGTPSVITCSTTSDFLVGMPVRYVVSGTTYWGIVTAVSTNASISVSGPALAAAATVSALAVGTLDMVMHEYLNISSFNAVEPNLLRDNVGAYFKWTRSAKAYLVRISINSWRMATTTQPYVNVQINGAAVSTENSNNGLTCVTVGVWADNTLASINSSNYDINLGEELEFATTVAGTGGTTAAGLSIHLAFVPEV